MRKKYFMMTNGDLTVNQSHQYPFREILCLGILCNIHWDVDKDLQGKSADWLHLKFRSFDVMIVLGQMRSNHETKSNVKLTTASWIVPFWKFNRLSVKLSRDSDALVADIFGACSPKAIHNRSRNSIIKVSPRFEIKILTGMLTRL